MECKYGLVGQHGKDTTLVGNDQFFVPGRGKCVDYVAMRRKRGKIEKKSLSVVNVDKSRRHLNAQAGYARQTNQYDKNTYFYKLNRLLPKLYESRGEQPTGKTLSDLTFKSLVSSQNRKINGNYMRVVGRAQTEDPEKRFMSTVGKMRSDRLADGYSKYNAKQRQTERQIFNTTIARPEEGLNKNDDQELADDENKNFPKEPVQDTGFFQEPTYERTDAIVPDNLGTDNFKSGMAGHLQQVILGDKVHTKYFEKDMYTTEFDKDIMSVVKGLLNTRVGDAQAVQELQSRLLDYKMKYQSLQEDMLEKDDYFAAESEIDRIEKALELAIPRQYTTAPGRITVKDRLRREVGMRGRYNTGMELDMGDDAASIVSFLASEVFRTPRRQVVDEHMKSEVVHKEPPQPVVTSTEDMDMDV